MVCPPEDTEAMRREFEKLQELGCECEWWDTPQVVAAHGKAAGFSHGIFFPKDGIIDSTVYARALLARVSHAVQLRENCSPVVRTWTTPEGYGAVELKNGEQIIARHVLMATGGLFLDRTLAGIVRPCYSYLVGLKHREPGSEGGMAGGSSGDTPNYFTYGFSHDWCVSNGFIRISGEDHFSALKCPRVEPRTRMLAEWMHTKYPYLPRDAEYQVKYGVYSEIPDKLPLVGSAHEGSAITYMVGCNAWGQASLSAVATLAPGLLGYQPMNEFQRDLANFTSIRRFNAPFVAADCKPVCSAKL
eukprot:c9756_g1_i1.p1 GENE.c9756_g1_i1~~c9756_g1_i1.p1  ORF type:complete len:302 (+),score=30.51 c9756_g1_i1:501-1406(+)